MGLQKREEKKKSGKNSLIKKYDDDSEKDKKISRYYHQQMPGDSFLETEPQRAWKLRLTNRRMRAGLSDSWRTAGSRRSRVWRSPFSWGLGS